MKFFRENHFGKKLKIAVISDNKKENSWNVFSHPLDEVDLMERSKSLIGELNPEMDRIADSYDLEENKAASQDTTVKTREDEIIEMPYPEVKITEKNRANVMDDIEKHPDLYMGLPVRERMGKIYTNQEFNDKRKKILAKRLP